MFVTPWPFSESNNEYISRMLCTNTTFIKVMEETLAEQSLLHLTQWHGSVTVNITNDVEFLVASKGRVTYAVHLWPAKFNWDIRKITVGTTCQERVLYNDALLLSQRAIEHLTFLTNSQKGDKGNTNRACHREWCDSSRFFSLLVS